MAEDEPSLMADRLDELRLKAEEHLKECRALKGDHKLALWLFLYHESSDVLVHSLLSHPTLRGMQTNAIVTSSQILGGLGTIGFVLRTGKTEVVMDTFDDPRGTVAIQDTLIKNYSWCGVPIRKEQADAAPAGIVSFFPVADSSDSPTPPLWNTGGVETPQRCLKTFVEDNHDSFLLLCELSLRSESNTFLKSSLQNNPAASFESEIGTLLRRLLSLGSPYAWMPYVAYVEKVNDDQNSGEHLYTCSSPSFLRCDIERLRVEKLAELQWKAINTSKFSRDHLLTIDAENTATIPLLNDGASLGNRLDLTLHLQADGHRIKVLIKNVYEPWKALFSSIYNSIETTLYRRDRKVLSESAASLFGLLARSILNDHTRQGFAKLLDDTKDQLEMLFEFLRGTYGIDAPDDESLAMRLRDIILLELELESARPEIIALSLWHSRDEWTVSESPGFHGSNLRKLGIPGNWKVLQRAAESGERATLKKYRPVNWSNINTWDLAKSDDEHCQLSWKERAISFSLAKCYFPLDLHICGLGFAQHLFDESIDSPLRTIGDSKLAVGSFLDSVTNVHRQLKGSYRVLATNEDGRRAIIIGPSKEPGKAGKEGETEASATLQQFALKELHAVLVTEYAKRITEASRRAAVAAIMARNASHNIGSHVLARHSVKDIDNDFTSKGKPKRVRSVNPSLFSFNGKIGLLPRLRVELRDSQILERYLQGRMDFVAQISTEWPEWTEAASLTGELLWGLLAQRILLEEIVASEGIGALEWEDARTKGWLARGTGRDGEIRFTCMAVSRANWGHIQELEAATVDDRRLEGEPFIYLTRDDVPTGLWKSNVSLISDPLIAIPGGVTGWHAFYIVIENLIRNAAKHGKWRPGRPYSRKAPLDVVIELLDEGESESYVIEEKQGRQQERSALLLRIYDNVSSLKPDTLNKINGFLNDSLIDESGRLRREHWGLAEMKMAAAFLQRRPIEKLDGGERAITGDTTNSLADGEECGAIIRAVRSPLNTLGYEFFLLKPRRLGIAPLPRKEERSNDL